jgi:aerobic-type carbon monoxide dehydrogenase small subunit (CoxS/CutS family)
MKRRIDFGLNGKPATLDIDEDRLLLWVLRTELELTGSKYGCGEGICGACTVMVEGKAVRSCRASLKGVAGKEIVTIEGLSATAPRVMVVPRAGRSIRCSRLSSTTALSSAATARQGC